MVVFFRLLLLLFCGTIIIGEFVHVYIHVCVLYEARWTDVSVVRVILISYAVDELCVYSTYFLWHSEWKKTRPEGYYHFFFLLFK